ncbi:MULTISPECIES: lytic polysaccharide monooxygenase [Bacillus cereus group]|uniref:lytic polysaccharide monooxygenase n=1 Tax=Bacillus cereus group TaxID=86661 RepID=UPI001F571C78|nr:MULTISPECIES: lytic polysaccharide monooxygenase [Bacillus cereus group]MDH2888530.1 lytic polysaccharide monooxygenase [Bacillus cytotoxicus]
MNQKKKQLSQVNARKRWRKVAPLAICGMMGALFLGESSASAHGYIENSRAHLGRTLEMNQISWQDAFTKYGSAVNEPQSIEAPKGFPLAGPADGKIASGGIPAFAPLDVQNPLHWKKIDIQSGKNAFVWKYTAEHKTEKWTYYMTKNGWDPSKPLTREVLEPIGAIDGEGKLPKDHPAGYVHEIQVPADREGYHLILGVWDVADTANAFYQVMDVNVQNDEKMGEKLVAPSAPSNVTIKTEAKKAHLKWDAPKDATTISHYNIYRNGEKLAPVTTTELVDENLLPNAEYTYEVTAVDRRGNESVKSMPLTVKTKELSSVDTEAPSAPKGLHSMGETETTVDLMWTASVGNTEIDHYQVYRNGQLLPGKVSGTRIMDKNLQPGTLYTYEVRAVDVAGNISEASNTLQVRTKGNEQKKEVTGLTTWEQQKVYQAGNRVLFNGYEYEAKWWTQGNQPDISDAWKLISDIVLSWNAEKAYQGGDKVKHDGVTYKAKWWTKGDVPGKSIVWEKE